MNKSLWNSFQTTIILSFLFILLFWFLPDFLSFSQIFIYFISFFSHFFRFFPFDHVFSIVFLDFFIFSPGFLWSLQTFWYSFHRIPIIPIFCYILTYFYMWTTPRENEKSEIFLFFSSTSFCVPVSIKKIVILSFHHWAYSCSHH